MSLRLSASPPSRFTWEVLFLDGCDGALDVRFFHPGGTEIAVLPYCGGPDSGLRFVVEVYQYGDDGREATARPLGTTDDRSTGVAMAVAELLELERSGRVTR